MSSPMPGWYPDPEAPSASGSGTARSGPRHAPIPAAAVGAPRRARRAAAGAENEGTQPLASGSR